MDFPVPIDRGLFFNEPPRPRIFDALANIDPRSTLYKDTDYMNFADRFTVRWHTLGIYFGVTRAVTHESLPLNQREFEEMITDHLLAEVMATIMEAYVEFWHLYYDGPMTLQQFTDMTGLEEFYYLDSNGDYIPGRDDYARICRLQQRDFGRFEGTDRTIRENL